MYEIGSVLHEENFMKEVKAKRKERGKNEQTQREEKPITNCNYPTTQNTLSKVTPMCLGGVSRMFKIVSKVFYG